MSRAGRAIPFIRQSASGALVIEAEAAALLRTVEAPVCVLAVVGNHRTGKSFLINSLLLSQPGQPEPQEAPGEHGFPVGNGLSTCTKGVWIYDQLVQLPRPDGSVARCLVLDTEGTGGADGDEQRDVLTWALTLLLSSFVIYNSTGAIDEHSISQLSLVTHVAGLLHAPDAGSSGGLFPSFLWLLRDFALELVSPAGEQITEQEYLDRALQPVDAAQPEAAAKNATRQTLRSCFRHLLCHTLVRPAIDEDVLQELGRLPLAQTRAKFQDQLAALRGTVAAACGDKHLRGMPAGACRVLYI